MKLDKIELYQKYPNLQPFIGKEFGKNNVKKILLVAESHYLPNGSFTLTADKWYKQDQSHLTKEEMLYIDTRTVVELELKKKEKISIFQKLSDALRLINPNGKNNGLDYVAYMNCFQRPAPNGARTIKPYLDKSGLDTQMAKNTISSVIELLQPDYVIFISKLSWDYVGQHLVEKFPKIKLDYTYHPSWDVHWKSENGLEKFQKIIK